MQRGQSLIPCHDIPGKPGILSSAHCHRLFSRAYSICSVHTHSHADLKFSMVAHFIVFDNRHLFCQTILLAILASSVHIGNILEIFAGVSCMQNFPFQASSPAARQKRFLC
ncbi:hypothetical protein AAC387_Pa03g0210 [Persea americana]